MNAETIATALGGARRSGNGWQAKCPAHVDDNPSLSLADGEGGLVLVYCHAGCPQDVVIGEFRKRGIWSADGEWVQRPTARKRRTGIPSFRFHRTRHSRCLPIPALVVHPASGFIATTRRGRSGTWRDSTPPTVRRFCPILTVNPQKVVASGGGKAFPSPGHSTIWTSSLSGRTIGC